MPIVFTLLITHYYCCTFLLQRTLNCYILQCTIYVSILLTLQLLYLSHYWFQLLYIANYIGCIFHVTKYDCCTLTTKICTFFITDYYDDFLATLSLQLVGWVCVLVGMVIMIVFSSCVPNKILGWVAIIFMLLGGKYYHSES